jgi:hypothetical protein
VDRIDKKCHFKNDNLHVVISNFFFHVVLFNTDSELIGIYPIKASSKIDFI